MQTYAPSGTPPTISGLSPTQGAVGISVTITGTNFTGASAVRFNGVTASYTVNSATSITATRLLGPRATKASLSSSENFTPTA